MQALSQFAAISRRQFSHATVPFPDRQLIDRFMRSPSSLFTDYYTLQHPKTLETYFKVAAVMQERGLIPFVHGRNASWYIPERILQAVGFRGCQSFRPSLVSSRSVAEVRTMIDERIQMQKTNWRYWVFSKNWTSISQTDHVPVLRLHLIAATIGLLHDAFMESPLSLVYGGSPSKYYTLPGNRSIMAITVATALQESMISDALKERGMNDESIQNILSALKPFYVWAHTLKRGHILAFGVPLEACDTFAYHSETYGYPTGIPIAEVLKKLPHNKCQVRLILSKETMSPESGISVVNIMDPTSVQAFLQDASPAIPLDAADILTKKKPDCDWEERDNLEFIKFQQELDAVIDKFKLMEL